MCRRSTPARLSEARWAATIARLIGEGELPMRADAKVAAWEAITGFGRPATRGSLLGRGIPLAGRTTGHGDGATRRAAPLETPNREPKVDPYRQVEDTLNSDCCAQPPSARVVPSIVRVPLTSAVYPDSL